MELREKNGVSNLEWYCLRLVEITLPFLPVCLHSKINHIHAYFGVNLGHVSALIAQKSFWQKKVHFPTISNYVMAIMSVLITQSIFCPDSNHSSTLVFDHCSNSRNSNVKSEETEVCQCGWAESRLLWSKWYGRQHRESSVESNKLSESGLDNMFGEQDDWSCFCVGKTHHQHTEVLMLTL